MISAIIIVMGMVFFEKPQEIKVPVRKEYINKYF